MAKLLRDAALDLVASASTNTNYQNLGTVPVVLAAFTSASNFTGIRSICISNKHSTQGVAFMTTTSGSPSFTASANGSCATTDGVPVLPLAQYFFNYATTGASGLQLWLVASAVSTPVTVSVWDKEIRG